MLQILAERFQFQMPQINAQSGVAGVANNFAFRNGPKEKNPNVTMCSNPSSFVFETTIPSAPTSIRSAWTISCDSAFPNPTALPPMPAAWYVHPGPEFGFGCFNGNLNGIHPSPIRFKPFFASYPFRAHHYAIIHVNVSELAEWDPFLAISYDH